MRIIIGADICVTTTTSRAFIEGTIEQILDESLIKELDKADYRVFNLEGPLIDGGIAIDKCGPCLKMPTASIAGIKKINPSLFTLANNHILDYGEEGLINTLHILDNNMIPYVGVGYNIENMKSFHCFTKEGKLVGIYACAEHEFSIASNNLPGANPYDPLITFDEINSYKNKVDYLIVLYHGGKEYYRYPTPMLQRIFRKMADSGANMVIAQHTHCIGSMENYNGNTLVYGQGNFIFDGGEDEFWNSGMLIIIDITENDATVSYLPFKKSRGRLECSNESALDGFKSRSDEIKSEEFINKKYMEFAKENANKYLMSVHGDRLLFKIQKRLGVKNLGLKMYSKPEGRNMLRNYIECESHRELLLEILSQNMI